MKYDITNKIANNAAKARQQNKAEEVRFFSQYANSDQYNVFTDNANEKIIESCIRAANFKPDMLIVDIGCGWGVFTRLLRKKGYKAFGVDICHALLVCARKVDPTVTYITADAEFLPFKSNSLDAVLLSALIHHLPDSSICAKEIYRVLKPNGVFAAFDPNRRNPFMWLYRDWQSPFYSKKGVTENERPILAEEISSTFEKAGFEVSTGYLSGLSYRYVASDTMRKLLPIYNFFDQLIFQPSFMKKFGAFIITSGRKK